MRKTKITTLTLLLVGIRIGFPQDFINLNFEAAKNLGSPGSFDQLSVTNAFPGWTVLAAYIVYDDVSLSGESISVIDTNNTFGLQPIQGKYFTLLASANYPGTGLPISIGQTGMIPLGAQSIEFWVR